jgi:hypothetical protein
MKIMLGDFNGKLGGEDNCKLKLRKTVYMIQIICAASRNLPRGRIL